MSGARWFHLHACTFWSTPRRLTYSAAVPSGRASATAVFAGLGQLVLGYFGIGSHFGVATPQNAKGHLLGDVTDQGRAVSDPTSRGNEIGGHPLDFHSDGSDLVGLLCIDAGASGGETLVGQVTVGAVNFADIETGIDAA